jgi:hypothetical protein
LKRRLVMAPVVVFGGRMDGSQYLLKR